MTDKTNNEETGVIHIRLTKDQIRILDAMAKSKKYTRNFYVKQILIKEIFKKEETENILLSSQNKILDILNRQETESDYFRGLYLAFMTQWFFAHPSPENISKTESLMAAKKKALFIEKYNNEIYEEAGNLYDKLFANNIENQTDDEQ